MKMIILEPMLAALVGGWEILLVLLVLLILPSLALGYFVLRHYRPKENPSNVPPRTVPLTKRICPQCGKEMSPTSNEGLCPACLMKVAMGSEGGNPDAPKESKPAPPPAEIARHFPQLDILELLGQGGMGMVYKARQKQLDRVVALKILPSEFGRDAAFAERFSREAKALARLNHPNIVSVYDFGQADGLYYFLMEYVDGVNLRQMEESRRLTPPEALVIIPKICDALQYAHDEGFVHRDIKPENILLDKKGRVKIADFGLAKILGRSPKEFQLTGSHHVMGTPHYMAPEQMEHPLDVDHRADIYSLGVVFYEMLTGELPLGRFAPPSSHLGAVQVDVRLDEVVLKTLENEPGRRYQHASEVKTDVENISGLIEKLPLHLRHAIGFEYKSKRTLFGLPLIHVTSGIDQATGKRRTARGIIAIGDTAKGVFAFGGFARGVIAFGGCAIGVIALGGLSFGLFSLGGLALGLIISYGGLAIAPIAFGGMAVGYFAFGGGAFGVHPLGGNADDAMAQRFFLPWARDYFGLMNAAMFVLMFVSIGVGTIIPAVIRKKMLSPDARTSPPQTSFWVTSIVALLLLAGLVGFGVWSAYKSIQRPDQRRANVSEPNASDILRKMEAKYDSLLSFSATGKTTSETKPVGEGGAKSFSSTSTFTIKLARPDYYRIEWTQTVGEFYTNHGAVWFAGGNHSLFMGENVSTPLNRQLALSAATGVSGGAAHTVPSLFFKDQTLDWLNSLTNLSRQPDAKIDNEDCYVVSADGRIGRNVLWITQKKFFLKQIQQTSGGGLAKAAASKAFSETDDASLKKVLKMVGQEATPEAVSKMRKDIESANKNIGQIQATITQTFQNIVADEIMEKEDFNYPVAKEAAASH